MSDTNFTNLQTTVEASWLQDLNDVVYRLLGASTGPGGAAPTTVAEIVANIGAASLSTSNTFASGTTQDFESATMLVSGAASGTAQPVQAQQLANDSLPVRATSGPGATAFALRNRIINGNFQINQRVYTSGAALTSGTYAHDRWKAGSGGCTYTFTQAANGQQITITAGSLEQVIEDANIEGGTYTLSWTGTASGSVNGGAAAASPITVTGLPASTAATVSFGTGTVGEVQFEPGPTATPFEQLPIDKVLASCQRYFYSTYPDGVAPGATSQDNSGVAIYCPSAGSGEYYSVSFALPSKMRTVPTPIVYSSHTGAIGKAYMQNAAGDQPAAIGYIGQGIVTPGLANATVVAGDVAKLHFTLSAEL